ncbi:MAG TPA: ribonuclease III [Patescibacteria group bacterium]|nr:ribonuclease III [Patescibacteria group bacterium]
MSQEKDLSQLEEKIGIKFQNQDLLRQAVVHRSYLNENPGFRLNNNERLEFLGDAVLEIIVTEYLYYNFPEEEEGKLTNYRASLVNTYLLAVVAQEVELESFLYLSRGESKDRNEKARRSILADTVEAVVGAIYLDQGKKAAEKFIKNKIIPKLDNILANRLYLDPKSKFQEEAQEKYGITPHYKVLKEEGPDHAKIFEVGLYLEDKVVAKGRGSSKQEAQVKAAEEGIRKEGW